MFSSLFKHAQASVEETIGQALLRAAAAVPFLIAAGFATAALTLRLQREFGGELAFAIMAGGFVIVGLMMWAYVAVRTRSRAGATAASTATEAESPAASKSENPDMSAADRELMLSALTAAAPLVLPSILRTVLRNLPLLAAIAAAIFVLTRPASSASDAVGASEPPDPAANTNDMSHAPPYAMAAE